jgi:hypothetical protein
MPGFVTDKALEQLVKKSVPSCHSCSHSTTQIVTHLQVIIFLYSIVVTTTSIITTTIPIKTLQ